MKKWTWKLVTILIYIFMVLFGMGFQVSMLWNWKEFIVVVLGAVILMIPYCRDTRQMKKMIGWNFLMAGYLTAFLFLFGNAGNSDLEVIEISFIVKCFRPILYGLIFYVVFHEDEKKEIKEDLCITDDKTKDKQEDNCLNKQVTLEEILRKKGLTTRECEVANAMLHGLSNKEIAEEMCISETTVKKHVSHVFEKLQLTKRDQIKNILNQEK